MLKSLISFLLIMLFSLGNSYAQQSESHYPSSDSFSTFPNHPIADAAPANLTNGDEVKLNFQSYFTLLGYDFKKQISSPFHTSSRDWLKIAGFSVVASAVTMVNKPINNFAQSLALSNPRVAATSKHISGFGGNYQLYAMAGAYAYGLIFKSQKVKTTTLLATQAYITSVTWAFAAKWLAGEQRPYYTDPNYSVNGPIFRGPLYIFKKSAKGDKLSSSDYASFPSGHTTAAFSAATVYAMEYRDKPIIPILSYTAASLVGLSRLTENKHWASDVLVGAMLGYLSGRQVVRSYHKYASSLSGKQHQPLTINLQYGNNQFSTGLLYHF